MTVLSVSFKYDSGRESDRYPYTIASIARSAEIMYAYKTYACMSARLVLSWTSTHTGSCDIRRGFDHISWFAIEVGTPCHSLCQNT
jgi:hypothetical protein